MTAASLGADEFEQAFVRHGRSLWVLACAWVGRGDAADLVQEAARVGWQRRTEVEPGSDVRAWLAQIARHLGANWRRRRRPVAMAPADLPEPAARGGAQRDPFTPFALGISDDVARALAGLGETARACLLLHAVTEHTFAEIGTMLDLPENTVASHVRRARLAVRDALATRCDATPMPETP